jgi:hypothetical protein
MGSLLMKDKFKIRVKAASCLKILLIEDKSKIAAKPLT